MGVFGSKFQNLNFGPEYRSKMYTDLFFTLWNVFVNIYTTFQRRKFDILQNIDASGLSQKRSFWKIDKNSQMGGNHLIYLSNHLSKVDFSKVPYLIYLSSNFHWKILETREDSSNLVLRPILRFWDVGLILYS